MRALAIYLRELRQARRVKQEELAKYIGMSVRQFARIEQGRHMIKADDLMRIMTRLGAPFLHIQRMLEDNELPDTDVLAMVQEALQSDDAALSPDDRNRLAQLGSTLSSQQLQRFIALISDLDPRQLSQLEGYAERLRDETPQAPA